MLSLNRAISSAYDESETLFRCWSSTSSDRPYSSFLKKPLREIWKKLTGRSALPKVTYVYSEWWKLSVSTNPTPVMTIRLLEKNACTSQPTQKQSCWSGWRPRRYLRAIIMGLWRAKRYSSTRRMMKIWSVQNLASSCKFVLQMRNGTIAALMQIGLGYTVMIGAFVVRGISIFDENTWYPLRESSCSEFQMFEDKIGSSGRLHSIFLV